MSKEKSKEQRIKLEERRIRGLFKDLKDKELKTADGLIQRAAYMRIQLEDFEKDLDLNGYTEYFSQSEKTDPYERERPVARLYNTMIKNYAMVTKQLKDLLPASQVTKVSDDLGVFLSQQP